MLQDAYSITQGSPQGLLEGRAFLKAGPSLAPGGTGTASCTMLQCLKMVSKAGEGTLPTGP